VWPHFVVVAPPGGDRHTCLGQGLEPLLVQALLAQLAVEALDEGVLHRLAGIDQHVPDALALRPAHERPAGDTADPLSVRTALG